MSKNKHVFKGNVPFSIKKIPFYYGWIVLVAGSLGVLFSIPGQTMGVSVYTDHLIENLGLTRVNISTAYMIGTLSSAAIMTKAGMFFDKFGARVTAAGSAFILGLCLIFLSNSVNITLFFSTNFGLDSKSIPFALMVIGFFGIRFSGQGVLTLVSRGMVMRWFEEHRGLASAIMGIFTSFGFSYAPRVLQALIDASSWENSWMTIALVLMFIIVPFILIIFRDSPEDCGIEIEEGVNKSRSTKKKIVDNPNNLTLKEARKDPQLWFYLAILFYWAMYNTAFTFHITSIFETMNKTSEEAVAIFLPISVLSVIGRFTGSWLSDFVKIKVIFYALIGSTLLGAFAITLPYSTISMAILIIGMGLSGGLYGVLTSVTWPKLYGREHLGAISGFAMTFMVAGSAVGPMIFSVMERIWGHYKYTGHLGMIMVGIIGLTSIPYVLKNRR